MGRIKIFYIITGLTAGGAELTLNKILTNINKENFELIVCSLTNTLDIVKLIKKNI